MRNVRRPSPSYDSDTGSDYSRDSSHYAPSPPSAPSRQQQQPFSQRGRRRSPLPSPTNYNRAALSSSVIGNRTFQKLLGLLFIIVLFDLYYVWDYFDNLDEHSGGPEAGLHHLHESRRLGNLYSAVLSRLQLDSSTSGESELQYDRNAPLHDNYDYLDALPSDADRIESLEHVVEAWKRKYEDAMVRLGENPFPDVLEAEPEKRHVPYTVVPPNGGNDDAVRRKKKKSKEELANEETYGADERIVKILHSANVEIDEELAKQLPTWDNVVSLYGETPIIRGLETCEPYRQSIAAKDRMTGPAGMFNTGTNLLFELLKENCEIPEARAMHREPRRNGMRWQVPWGKHNPPTTHRNRNVAKAWGKGIKQSDFFPVVLIKDPYSWMGSQCRHKYTTFWGHDDKHCPNLIRWRIPTEDVPSEVRVKYALEMKLYESLLDMWNKWYQEWHRMDFPHLTTRFEDLLFHGEEVTRTVCECVGGTFTDNFEFVEDSAKQASYGIHKGANGLVKAMLQYGDPEKRLVGFTDRDRIYASKTVDTELMRKYGYVAPPLP
eukprot:CAMPEP_0183711676 /NCGR_PEP_ID=MMETSP0737-20130205/7129_1 /TAXON_ID=385413 /ORGANISM="Thalassiosira miniscula, Strain CCMP1093" /LENGTH=547 /DNA_ID=CAMNT_0025940243 /DNA_START=30 /DNA_END=1673 /DNA_ORIENTATION=+